MHFWRIESLKAKLRAGAVDQRAAFGYVLAMFLLYTAATEIPDLSGEAASPAGAADWVAYAGSLFLVGLGTWWAFRANGGRKGADFVLRYLALGWVLGIRLAVVLALPVGLLLLAAAGLAEFAGHQVPEAVSDWTATLFGLALAAVYYWRLAHHLHDIAGGDAGAASTVEAASRAHMTDVGDGLSRPRTATGESRSWTAALAIGTCVSSGALLGVLAFQAAVLSRIARSVDGLPDVQSVASVLVDQIVEAGLAAPTTAAGDALAERRLIVLANAINEQTARSVVERLILLDSRDPRQPISLYLASPGGWGVSAFTIIDAMHTIQAPVDVHAIGYCHSACMAILVAATGTRTAAPQALLAIHANLDDASDPESYERLYNARYEGLWRQHAALPEEWFPMTRDRWHYLTPQQALELKIIDRIAPAPKRVPQVSSGADGHAPARDDRAFSLK